VLFRSLLLLGCFSISFIFVFHSAFSHSIAPAEPHPQLRSDLLDGRERRQCEAGV
jgi:hypothetical protein